MLEFYMKKFVLINLLILLFSNLAFSNENGKNLYSKANCQKCHKMVENFDPRKKQTRDYYSVESWVNSCSIYFKINWDPFEVEDVTNYLNDNYYHYKNINRSDL